MSACGGKISFFNMMTFEVTWQLNANIVCDISHSFYKLFLNNCAKSLPSFR
jgi:hypothetical protein